MKIVVGSVNPVKVVAVKAAFKKVYPQATILVSGIEVESGVSNQPMSDKESITGAANRAKNALRQQPTDYSVGIEAGIQQIAGEYYDSGWVVIQHKSGKIGIGSSPKMVVTYAMMELINQGKELGIVDDIVFGMSNSKQNLGHFGLMTNGNLSRLEAYTDGVICALAVFLTKNI